MASMEKVSTAPAKRSAGVLRAADDRHGHDVLGEVAVDFEHAHGFFQRFLFGGVRGVAFLPEELGRAQEQPRAHLPADHVGPLVDEQRQVAVALNPFLVGAPDDRLAGGPDDQRLFELARRINLDAALAVGPRAGGSA